jgi:hypothetical protein
MWHLPFLSFVTPADADAAGPAHLMNLPFASLQGAAIAGAVNKAAAVKASSNFMTDSPCRRGQFAPIKNHYKCAMFALLK